MDHQRLFLSRIEDIQRRLREANYECNQLKELVEKSEARPLPNILPQKEAPVTQQQKPVPPPVVKPPQIVPPVMQVPVTPPQPEKKPVEVITPPPAIQPPVVERVSVSPITPPPATPVSAKPAPPIVKPKSPVSIEGFIGGNLLNKIGIGILILGIGLFVKYAIDQEWIGPVGRILIGILSGSVLLTVAHLLRKKYKAFSSVLVGGGMTVLYLTIAIGYHVLHQFSSTGAFAIMCVITAFTVGFSLLYDRKEIAVMALIGGFVTPFITSNGEGNAVALFSYMLILNTGMILLAWFRKWPLINILSYIITVLTFVGWNIWSMANENPTEKVYSISAGFATAFFLQFFLMNIAHNLRFRQKFEGTDYLLLLSNTFVMYGFAMYSLYNLRDGKYMGLFTAAMAVFHFAALLVLRKRFSKDRNLIHLLVAIVLTFVTLAIPVQLKGNAITLFWAAEAVIALYMARKVQIRLMEIGGYVVSALAFMGLVWDLTLIYAVQETSMNILFNKGVLTSVFVAGAFMAIHFVTARSAEARKQGSIFYYLSIALLFGGLLCEVTWQAGTRLQFEGDSVLAGYFFTAAFASLLHILALIRKDKIMGTIMLVAGWAITLGYLVMVVPILNMNEGDWGVFDLHYISLATVLPLFALTTITLGRWIPLREPGGTVGVWASVIAFMVFASSEFALILTSAGLDTHTTLRAGLTILWGLSAAGMIVMGLKRKMLHLRIAALGIFALTILKLFIFDIRGIETAGKIAAFISLGILLLTISFLYQKLRFLLVDETKGSNSSSTGISE